LFFDLIAFELNVSSGVRRTITKSIWAEIHTAYASGIDLREIARNMDIPEGKRREDFHLSALGGV